jgi:DNA-binding beta-propeller fold protein YncE
MIKAVGGISILLLCACSVAPKPMEFKDTLVSVVWPAPPEKPRIRYLAQIRGPQDVVAEPGQMDRLFTLITGEKADAASFVTPMGIASDGKRFVYVADGAARLVHCFDLARQEVSYLRFAGDTPLRSPISVAVAPDGSIYVSDSVLARVFKFSADGELLGELRGASFKRPAGITVTPDGEKIVIDVLAHRLLLFDERDQFKREFLKRPDQVGLNYPTHVAIDRKKNVYITDSLNFRIVVCNWQGDVIQEFGEPGDRPGYFARPKGVAVDSDGHVYVVDSLQGNVQLFNVTGQLLLPVGNFGKRVGEFNLPSGIFIDGSDRIYITDTYNRRIQVFQYLKETIQ